MKRIKELRVAFNYTQKDLAEMLDTTQQTIARWESGKVEPNLATLRDLAVIFGVSTDEIIGKSPTDKKMKSIFPYYFGHKNANFSGYWGNFGVLLNGQKHTRWYPITSDERTRISNTLSNRGVDDCWFSVPTLNNRFLALNLKTVRKIWLLDEACDAPDDWNLEGMDVEGYSSEIYQGVDEYFLNINNWQETTSEKYRIVIQDFINEKNLDANNATSFLHSTTIYSINGDTFSYIVNEKDLFELFGSTECQDTKAMVGLHEFGGQFESYYPVNSLSMVDMPLLDFESAYKNALKEMG